MPFDALILALRSPHPPFQCAELLLRVHGQHHRVPQGLWCGPAERPHTVCPRRPPPPRRCDTLCSRCDLPAAAAITAALQWLRGHTPSARGCRGRTLPQEGPARPPTGPAPGSSISTRQVPQRPFASLGHAKRPAEISKWRHARALYPQCNAQHARPTGHSGPHRRHCGGS